MIRNRLFKTKRSIIVFITAILFYFIAILAVNGETPPATPVCETVTGINIGMPSQKVAWMNLNGNHEEEHIFIIGFFEQGIELFSTIFTFKYGPWQKWGLYSFVHEDATGKTWFTRKECVEETRKVSYTSLDITCGSSSFKGLWPNWKYSLNEPEFQAQLDIHAIAKPFDTGTCYYSQDKSVTADCFVYIPQGTVAGTLMLDGKVHKVSGEAYSDHVHQKIPFTRQGPFYYAVRAFPDFAVAPEQKIYLNFSQQTLHQSYGGGNDTFAFVVQGGRVLGFTRKLEIKPMEIITDKDTGYKYVRRVTINAQGQNFTVKGTFAADNVIETMDIFKWLPAYIRPIALKFWKRPVYFRFLGKFDGTLETAGQSIPIKQRATSEMNFTQ